MNFKLEIILTSKERTLNKIPQETLIDQYHYSSKKITITAVRNLKKSTILQIYKGVGFQSLFGLFSC